MEYKLTEDPEVVSEENARRRNEGLEGIMLKKVGSGYVPGWTGWRCVKMKEAEEAVGKLADTVDCVIMGYSAGKGKRAGFGLGQFLVGVTGRIKNPQSRLSRGRGRQETRNNTDDIGIYTVTKVGTGLSDELFVQLRKRLEKLRVKEMPKEDRVDKLLVPNFWVSPQVVVEIAGDEITKSPRHTSGFAVRFPRLVNIRDDKGVKEATTVGELKKLYEMQGGSK